MKYYNIERKTIPHKLEKRTCWRKSGLNDIDTYKLNLDYIISTLNVPFDYIQCDDYLCTNIKHHDDIQYFFDHIISAWIQTATDIPKTSQSPNIPGWNMHVEESKKTSLFWHDLWRINGSPRQGTIADIMRRTRAKYHYGNDNELTLFCHYSKTTLLHKVQTYMCKHNVMEIILKHNYVDNIWPTNKLLYCHLIINSAYGTGIDNCIYKILIFSVLSIILPKKQHAQYAENNT